VFATPCHRHLPAVRYVVLTECNPRHMVPNAWASKDRALSNGWERTCCSLARRLAAPTRGATPGHMRAHNADWQRARSAAALLQDPSIGRTAEHSLPVAASTHYSVYRCCVSEQEKASRGPARCLALRLNELMKSLHLWLCASISFLPVQEAKHCPRTILKSLHPAHPRPCFNRPQMGVRTQHNLPCVARACVHAVSEATRHFDLRLVG